MDNLCRNAVRELNHRIADDDEARSVFLQNAECVVDDAKQVVSKAEKGVGEVKAAIARAVNIKI